MVAKYRLYYKVNIKYMESERLRNFFKKNFLCCLNTLVK